MCASVNSDEFLYKFFKNADGSDVEEKFHYLSLRFVEIGKMFICKNFRLINTKNGLALAVDFENECIWTVLPTRLRKLIKSEDDLDFLNSKKIVMFYKGIIFNKHVITFIDDYFKEVV